MELGTTLAILLLFSVILISGPQMGWDAKSIWFLQYKQIFFAKTVGMSAGWGLSELSFSHSDYPKLHALLGAHWLETSGLGWEERRAKFSLVMLLLILWISTRALAPSRFLLFFWVVLTCVPGEKIFSGYMDVWCAGFSVLGASAVFIKDKNENREKVFLGWVLLVLAAQVKNEGILILSSCIFVSLFFSRGFGLQRHRERFFLLGAALLWPLLRHTWGLKNDLQLGGAEYLSRLQGRILDPSSWSLILRSAFWAPSFTGALGVLALVVCWRSSRDVGSKDMLRLWISGFVYWMTIILIYLGTPHDLVWHLGTSASRVFLFSGQLWTLVLLLSLMRPPPSLLEKA